MARSPLMGRLKILNFPPIHIPDFNPPVPNLRDKNVMMRIDCIRELENALLHLDQTPRMTAGLINSTISRLKKG